MKKKLQHAGYPFVGCVFVEPCPSEFSVERRRKDGLVVGGSLDNTGEQGIMVHAHYIDQSRHYFIWSITGCISQSAYSQASDASSASLKRPGRNQVSERSEDSTVEIVETLLKRKDSYAADMTVWDKKFGESGTFSIQDIDLRTAVRYCIEVSMTC